MNNESMGAPWKPLTGLIDPFEDGSNDSNYEEINEETTAEINEKLNEQFQNSSYGTPNEDTESKFINLTPKPNSPIEKIFLYVAMLLCIAILVGLVYWVFNTHVFYSLLIVLVSVIFYCLVYIANFRDYVEDTNTHQKITSGWTIVTLALCTLMLLVVVKNKRRFM
jgi:hypothetical protein